MKNKIRMISSATLLFFVLIFFILSCERDEIDESPDKNEVVFSTDKNSYMNLQDIAFKLSNRLNNNVSYFGCFFGSSPVIELEQYTNEEWEIKHFTLCVEYSWHQLLQNQDMLDTIHSNWFEPGKYRLVIELMKDTIQIPVYSNEFEIK